MSSGQPRATKPLQWLRGSGFRIALIFSLATVGLLLVVNIFVSQRSNQLFYASIPFSRNAAADTDYRYSPPTAVPPALLRNLAVDYPDQLHEILVWVTVTGGLAALMLGLVLGYIFITKPLRRLQYAIEQLKEQRFHAHIKPTGLSEFDYVLSEFNELATELGRAEELRKNLISDTSHELKTPIQSLILQIEGMRDGLIPKNAKQFELLLRQTNKLDTLTERLQDYARLRSQLVGVQLKPCKLMPILENVIQEFSPKLEAAGVRVAYEVEPTLTVKTDNALLERLFANLIQNTLTHAQATIITIEANKSELTFADNGKGVPAGHMKHLFERFYQVNAKGGQGLGLGLGIVHDIAEAHRWSVRATSNNGKGLTIHLKF